jgi:hypothetical protein
MINYATFPDDFQFHLLKNSAQMRTLCGLPTKGVSRGARERRPPAVVTSTKPMPIYILCSLCEKLANSRGISHLTPAT